MSYDLLVSVVIPTYNRAASLRETLDSLARQTYPADRFEVIVVDDGSTDGTPEVANLAFPYRLRYVRQDNAGSAAARNHGAQKSSGDLLIFLDDDITVETEFVGALVRLHMGDRNVVGMGTFRPWLPDAATPFQRVVSGITKVDATGEVCFTECTSNNVSILREDFFVLGMWQDVAGDGATLWGDVEFGYRAHLRGFRFMRSAEAILYHRDYAAVDLKVACSRSERAARLAIALFQRHPELVSMLPMFRDKIPIDIAADPPTLIIRKLLRMMASSRLAVWGMKQVVRRLETHFPKPWLLRPLYRWIIGAYIFRGYRQGLRQLRKATC